MDAIAHDTIFMQAHMYSIANQIVYTRRICKATVKFTVVAPYDEYCCTAMNKWLHALYRIIRKGLTFKI